MPLATSPDCQEKSCISIFLDSFFSQKIDRGKKEYKVFPFCLDYKKKVRSDKVKWFVFRVIKLVRRLCRRQWRRIVSVAFVSALLLSCVSVGVTNVQEVKAVAVADDYAMLAEGLKIIISFACSAAGASNSDIVTTTSAEGITDYKGAKQYVHDSFSGNENFSRIFSFNPNVMLKIESAMAKSAIAGGRILGKTLLTKIWSQYTPNLPGVDGTSAKKIEIISNCLKIVGGTDFNNDDDGDDEEDDEDNTSEYNSDGEVVDISTGQKMVLDPKVAGLAPSLATFKAVYTLCKYLNKDDSEKRFEDSSDTADPPNYSREWWASSTLGSDSYISPFLHLQSLNNNLFDYKESFYNKNYYSGFEESRHDFYIGFTPNFLKQYNNDKFYPVVYFDNGSPVFKIITTCKWFNGDVVSAGTFVGYNLNFIGGHAEGDATFDKTTTNFSIDDITFNSNYMTAVNYSHINDCLRHIETLIPGIFVQCPYLLNCGTLENAEKLESIIKSGVYSADDIEKCLVDSWKGDVKKTHKAIEDDGETSQKNIDSSKGDKYKTKGTKKDKDGKKQTDQQGITWKSFTDGMSSSTGQSGTYTGVSSLIGDEVKTDFPLEFPEAPKSSEIEQPNPGTETNPGSNPNPNPGTETNPDTNPGTEPGKNPDVSAAPDSSPAPGTNPGSEENPDTGINPGTGSNPDTGTNPGTGSNPGTGTDPGTDSDKDKKDEKLEDIKPDDVKTPTLLKKFPFCIPWDVVDLVSSVSAEKKAPKWELPFKMGNKTFGYKVDEKVVIDLSKYETLAVICR